MVWVKMWVNCLTHTVTHTRKCADRFKEYRRGGFAFSPIFLMFFFCSHHLCHEAAHFLRGLLLYLPCDVGVGSQGEARVVVSQHAADGFDVYSVLKRQGCEGVSEIVKANVWQSRVLQYFLV